MIQVIRNSPSLTLINSDSNKTYMTKLLLQGVIGTLLSKEYSSMGEVLLLSSDIKVYPKLQHLGMLLSPDTVKYTDRNKENVRFR